MTLGNIISAGSAALVVIGLGAGYYAWSDARYHHDVVAQAKYENIQLQLADSAIQRQVIAKESRLRDIEAALDRIAVTEATRPLTAVEAKRKRQLEAQYTAIVNELEKLQ